MNDGVAELAVWAGVFGVMEWLDLQQRTELVLETVPRLLGM